MRVFGVLVILAVAICVVSITSSSVHAGDLVAKSVAQSATEIQGLSLPDAKQTIEASSPSTTLDQLLASMSLGSQGKGKPVERSSYCSSGCSSGCSTGCSSGCSVGCSVGCSSGCSVGCR